MNYLRFSESVEVLQPNEEEISAEIEELTLSLLHSVFDRRRHAVRAVHAKSHGILKGELVVAEGLPPHLAQGLLAKPARHPVIIRLSTAPGDVQHDSNRAVYGFAVKVLGVEGKKVLPDDCSSSQDLLFNNSPILPFGHVRSYLEMARVLAASDGTPEGIGRAFSTKMAGGNPWLENIAKLRASATAYNNILGEIFYSIGAIRYGDYIAKISLAPQSPELRRLTGVPVDAGEDFSAIRNFVVDFFRAHSAEYTVRAQLCTDLETMPIEDASILWSEEQSPHQPIARLVIPQQEAYGAARRAYADDVLSFTPWRAIAEHRPLGSIMRVRRRVYEASSRFRHGQNMQPIAEPKDIAELPD